MYASILIEYVFMKTKLKYNVFYNITINFNVWIIISDHIFKIKI